MSKTSESPDHTTARVFYCPALRDIEFPVSEDAPPIDLSPEETRHACQVLRLRTGDPVRLFDGAGFFYHGEIAETSRRTGRVRVSGRSKSATEPRTPLTLLIALAKGRKPDLVIQKSVELGVSRIALFPSLRSVVRVDDAPPEGAPRERYDNIVVAASKQCGRARLMDVRVFPGLPEAIASLDPASTRFAFWEEARDDASPALPPLVPGTPICALIGPEGGLTQDEIARAREAGFQPAGLGPRILRAETAALAAATLLLGAAGDLGSSIPQATENQTT